MPALSTQFDLAPDQTLDVNTGWVQTQVPPFASVRAQQTTPMQSIVYLPAVEVVRLDYDAVPAKWIARVHNTSSVAITGIKLALLP